MRTILITLPMLLLTIFATAQTKFEQGMGKAFATWGEGRNTEAAAMFERIAAAEQGEWLPDYYTSLINTIAAFQTQNKDEVFAYLTKAQQAYDNAAGKEQNNAELLVLQAMIHTGYIAHDPMTYGRTLSGKVKELYLKALTLEPENPRAVYGWAEFELHSAKYFNADITPICARIDRAVELFATFKPKTSFHPKWGADRAIATQSECKK